MLHRGYENSERGGHQSRQASRKYDLRVLFAGYKVPRKLRACFKFWVKFQTDRPITPTAALEKTCANVDWYTVLARSQIQARVLVDTDLIQMPLRLAFYRPLLQRRISLRPFSFVLSSCFKPYATYPFVQNPFGRRSSCPLYSVSPLFSALSSPLSFTYV